ncbi:MAG TPA: sensor histidine kinase [Ktedonobacterales bacterium]|nr:sensor histidine kinase [Ktedonobacterales bacterium]
MTELERAARQQYRIQVFWIGVTFADLLFCLWAAGARTPGLYLTWRGAALLAVAALYAYRMSQTLRRPGPVSATESPAQLSIRVWVVTLILTLALFALHPMMGWMCYPLFGMAFMFELPWAILPAALAYLFLPVTLLANGFETPRDLLNPVQALVWAVSFPAYAALVYLPAKLMRDRLRRERNMAELQRVYHELEQAHQRLAASAEQERELAVLRERARLARDMHDTLGHALVLVAVKLEAVRRLREVDTGRAERELAATQQIVRDAMGELRASLADLRSPTFERESLGRMLGEHAHAAAQRAGWHVVYDLSADLATVDPAIREALLRVGAEALTNAERHAQAGTVTLTLQRDLDDAIVLRVADDGVGISTSSRAPAVPESDTDNPALGQHYGITGMRERITALGGHFSIASGATGGTVMEAWVPTTPGHGQRTEEHVAAGAAPVGERAPDLVATPDTATVGS